MSGTGEVRADFAGEERLFRIRLGEIRRIEAKCGGPEQPVAIFEVVRRLSRAVYLIANADGDVMKALAIGIDVRADDVHEVLYQGLLGGNMAAPEAAKLLKAEVGDRGLRGILDNVGVALEVLWGSQETPPGEPTAGTPQTETGDAAPPNPSTSPTSTGPEPPSA